MKRHWRAAAAGVAALGLFAFSSAAGAVPPGAAPPLDTGFDDLPDVAIGGGSDTTYLLSGDLTLLYSRGPGCPIVTSSSDPNKGKCQPAALPGVGPFTNWDRDALVEATPTGSSSGVNALLPPSNPTTDCVLSPPEVRGVPYNPPIDYARSSRGPQDTACGPTFPEVDYTTFWGYAQDGIAVYSFGTRLTGNFSTPVPPATNAAIDLYNIYNCTLTRWEDIDGYTGAPGDIFVYGINPNSGTYASFRDYLRTVGNNPLFEPNAQSCVRKVAGADGTNGTPDDVYAFENDLKIQLDDKGPDNVADTADDVDDNKITWSSGSIQSFPYLRQSGKAWQIVGVAPDPGPVFAQTYPINRTVNHVTRNGDADCDPNPDTGSCVNDPAIPDPEVLGAAGGPAGAVREFTRFLCRTTNAQHQIDPVTGVGYKTEINAIIANNGFTQVPIPLRTSGYACRVQT